MDSVSFPSVGRRKLKSLLVILIAFVIWQPVRLLIPGLDVHPIFMYLFSIIEIRQTHEDTARLGKLRIKATVIGLSTALLFLFAKSFVQVEAELFKYLFEIIFVLAGVLITISAAQAAKCHPLCVVAATVFIVCVIGHDNGDVYLYALLRGLQTIAAVLIAYIVNKYTFRKTEEDIE